MPIFGLGIHVLIAIFFAVHAVRNQRNLYWLFVLLVFPGLGSLAYLFIEYLPGFGVNRGMNKAAATAVGFLDPAREVREAREAFDLSPSAQNRLRLAKALLARGETHESIQHFDACLTGPFSKDPEFLYAAATAKLQDGQIPQALELAKILWADVPDYLAERAMLLLAEAYAAADDQDSARVAFSAAVERFGSIEAKARYAIWAVRTGDLASAKSLYADIAQSERYWTAHTRSLNRPLLQQLERTIAAVRT